MIESFEWDPGKAKANAGKHLVDFADAVEVLFDNTALTVPDHDPHEERYATLGMDALGRVLVVIYCWRGDRIRIISARGATPRERKHYGRAR